MELPSLNLDSTGTPCSTQLTDPLLSQVQSMLMWCDPIVSIPNSLATSASTGKQSPNGSLSHTDKEPSNPDPREQWKGRHAF